MNPLLTVPGFSSTTKKLLGHSRSLHSHTSSYSSSPPPYPLPDPHRDVSGQRSISDIPLIPSFPLDKTTKETGS